MPTRREVLINGLLVLAGSVVAAGGSVVLSELFRDSSQPEGQKPIEVLGNDGTTVKFSPDGKIIPQKPSLLPHQLPPGTR